MGDDYAVRVETVEQANMMLRRGGWRVVTALMNQNGVGIVLAATNRVPNDPVNRRGDASQT